MTNTNQSGPVYLHILGRQPALGLAELEARYGAAHVRPVPPEAALVSGENPDSFGHLGGSVKIGKLLATLPSPSFNVIIAQIERELPQYLHGLPDGKLKFGLSAYGFKIRPQQIKAAGLQLKKAIKATGRSVRVVPNQTAALSSAQTLHNQLTGELGIELLLVCQGQSVLLARAVHVQDIEGYTLRDRGRPMRDAKVGMLPPKLAQTIINLAVKPSPHAVQTVLDPFCGTGVVLQEALLMNHKVYGTDIDERMVRYTSDNIHWLQEMTNTVYSSGSWQLERGDATEHLWRQPLGAIVGETYLGPPLKSLPAPAKLQQIVQDCDSLHRKFLKNLAPQLQPGTPLCLAVPAWITRSPNSRFRTPDFRHLPLLDDLDALGYNRVDFKHVQTRDLVYYREDQIVARELLVLTRK